MIANIDFSVLFVTVPASTLLAAVLFVPFFASFFSCHSPFCSPCSSSHRSAFWTFAASVPLFALFFAAFWPFMLFFISFYVGSLCCCPSFAPFFILFSVRLFVLLSIPPFALLFMAFSVLFFVRSSVSIFTLMTTRISSVFG